jgi:two-component system chemotaxis sensor kinase CheA
MDVVRRNVEALRGSVAIATAPGRGTTFALRLPLSLAIIQGFRVAVAGDVHVVPLDAILECAALPRDAGPGTGLLGLRGEPLPVLRLRERFGIGGAAERESVLVVRHGASRAGLVVDALLGECQAVVKPLGPAMRGTRGLAGTSVLGDGRVAMVLDVAALLRDAVDAAAPIRDENAEPGEGRT